MLPVSGPITVIIRADVEHALGQMKNGNVVGPMAFPTEAWKACGSVGMKWLNKLSNTEIKRQLGAAPIIWKAQEHHLRWYGYVERRSDEYMGKTAQWMAVVEKRWGGRPRQHG